MLLVTELFLCVATLVLALACPRIVGRWFRAIERRVSRFAAHRRLAVLTILLLAVGVRLIVLPIEPIPVPGIHDEFSYLLMADTFAHGRLANATHPMWKHFESMAIIQRPTYSSVFYPAQGGFLALGQVLFRHPFWGVWLSTALMCAAVCWALQAWMPPNWAFLGGILVILRLGTFSYWADSYWGGSVAAIGGALAFGALPRIKRRVCLRDTIILSLGLTLLANSRPYEGLFFSIPIAVALALFVLRNNEFHPVGIRLRHIVLPFAGVMAVNFAWIGYYFFQTTHNPLVPPYLVDISTYMPEPQFFWQNVHTASPVYNHSVMQKFYEGYHMQVYSEAHFHPVLSIVRRIFGFWIFFLGPTLTLPFMLLAFVLPYGTSFKDFRERVRLPAIIVLVSLLGSLLPIAFLWHYAAATVCTIYALTLHAMRRVRVWQRKSLTGVAFVRGTVLSCVGSFGVTAVALTMGTPRQELLIGDLTRQNLTRSTIEQNLSRGTDRHLVFVHYSPGHDPHDEWVYNAADIDASKVVWAREMSPDEDQRLVKYFNNRVVWVLEADATPPRLERLK